MDRSILAFFSNSVSEGLSRWSFGTSVLAAVVAAAWALRIIGIMSIGLRKRKYTLPPGPRAYPFIGNMLQMKGEVPEVWWNLAQKNDWPVMSFRWSNKLNVIVSNPEMTKEMLVTKGNIFNSRERDNYHKLSMRVCSDGKTECGALFTPHGYAWKMTRKLMVASQKEFKKSVGDDYVVNVLLPRLYEEIDSEVCVNVRFRIAKMMSLKILLVFIFGPGAEQYADMLLPLNDKQLYLVDMNNFIELIIPIIGKQLSWAWHTFRLKRSIRQKHHLYDSILSERGIKYNQGKQWSMCDMVREAEKKGQINHHQALQIYEECIFGGQDTTAGAIEGILKILVENPEVLSKLQQEMDNVIGAGTQFKHSDVERLPYFRAVIKEGLRLHRTFPVLLPHTSNEDATLGGYDIPKDTDIIVNLWGISRNPVHFPDPYAVKPERFLDRETDFNGTDCTYVVFGLGQRICPGQTWALFMVNIVIGSLCRRYSFALGNNWKHERDAFSTFFREVALYLELTKRHE